MLSVMALLPATNSHKLDVLLTVANWLDPSSRVTVLWPGRVSIVRTCPAVRVIERTSALPVVVLLRVMVLPGPVIVQMGHACTSPLLNTEKDDAMPLLLICGPRNGLA